MSLDGDRDGAGRERREVGIAGEPPIGQGGVPDLPGSLPRGTADGGGGQVERPVGDAGVDVHAAVVVDGVDEVAHVPRLRVLAQRRVVVRAAGLGHRPQRTCVNTIVEQARADQPACLVGTVPEHPLQRQRGEHVGDALVERPGLALVGQRGAELGDAMGELVRDDVHRLGEPPEDLAVAVTEHQPAAVPERVGVIAAVVHGGVERMPAVVDRVAAVDLLEQLPARAHTGVRLVDRRVARRRLPLRAHQAARERGLVAGVVDRAVRATGDRFAARSLSLGTQVPVGAEGVAHTGLQVPALGRVAGEGVEQVRRDELAAAHPPFVPEAPAPTGAAA